MQATRHDHTFESQGTSCAGWLYEPTAVEQPPVVVMAHGFGGERTWRLPAFAERFAEAGIATFLFDYRTFGDSEGEPQNLIDPFEQRADWHAAVDYVQSLPEVDGDSIALWGSSFSGGHVVEVAARRDDVAAVVAQVPFVDGARTVGKLVRAGGFAYLENAVTAAIRDLGRIVLRREPYYVPLAGPPEEFAILNTPDAMDGIEALIPEGEEWDNRCPARIALTVLFYRPISRASDVEVPVFVVQAEDDTIIPDATTDRLVRELDDVERVRYPVGHFDVYRGDPFENIVSRQRDFLRRHLRG